MVVVVVVVVVVVAVAVAEVVVIVVVERKLAGEWVKRRGRNEFKWTTQPR